MSGVNLESLKMIAIVIVAIIIIVKVASKILRVVISIIVSALIYSSISHAVAMEVPKSNTYPIMAKILVSEIYESN